LETRFIITKDGSHTLYSEQFKATYHSVNGAIDECKHVFIKNGLNNQINRLGVNTLSILEIGFGSGLNAFLTCIETKQQAISINYHTVEAFPISANEVEKLNFIDFYSEEDKTSFKELHQCQWGKTNTISNSFKFSKHLCLINEFKSNQTFDIIYFDAFSPKEQPELWTEDIFKQMFELLNNHGILVTYCAQGQMKRNLKSVGFKVKALPGSPGKREMTLAIKEI